MIRKFIRDLSVGDRFKSGRKWYTLTGDRVPGFDRWVYALADIKGRNPDESALLRLNAHPVAFDDATQVSVTDWRK